MDIIVLFEYGRYGFQNLKTAMQRKIVAAVKLSSNDNKIDEATEEKSNTIPESVNYHFTRTCNYSCGFCFHTAKTSFNLPLEEAKRGLEMLVKEGMKKVCLQYSRSSYRHLTHLLKFVSYFSFDSIS